VTHDESRNGPSERRTDERDGRDEPSDLTPAADGPDGRVLPAGTRVGHYEILHELGRGGMGVVYEARDVVLGRLVALKTPLFERGSDARTMRRFLREAQATSRLSHPGIVPVFEAFEDAGAPWIAMELVRGRSLRSIIQSSGPLPVSEIIEHLRLLSAALHAAHLKGVLHRDIKPSNILIGEDGLARLTDFGLARLLFAGRDGRAVLSATNDTLTADGALVGTIAYMSPEQVLSRPLDARSDIFSLGAVFYEMCTGKGAFRTTSEGETINAILNTTPRPISDVNRAVPARVAKIVGKCLAKRPDDRYQSANELVADLQACRSRSGSSAIGLAIGPVTRSARRRRLLVAAAAGIAVAAVAAQWIRSRGADDGLPSFRPRQITSRPGLEEEPAISPDGTEIAYSATVAGNRDIWIVDVRGGEPLRLTSHPASDTSPTWFPDGSSVAFTSDRTGEAAVWKVPHLGGAPVHLVQNAEDPAVSPDGAQIAFVRADSEGFRRVAVAPLDDPSRVRILTTADDGLWSHRNPAWSPDGTMICYQDFRNLWLVPVDDGRPRPLTTDDPADIEPAWSTDGRFMYYASLREATRAIWRRSIRGGEPVRLTIGTGPEGSPTVAGNGKLLAYSTSSEDTSILLIDQLSGITSRFHETRELSEPGFAPDGNAVVFASTRENAGDLWLVRLDGVEPVGEPVRLTDHPGSAAHPVVSNDGRWIAYHRVLEGRRDLWLVPAAGGEPRQFTDNEAADVHPEWSPDDSQLAFVSDRSGTMQVWVAPVAEGRRIGEERRVTRGEGSALFPSWSADGSRVAYVLQAANQNEVWIAGIDGDPPARQVTVGAGAFMVKWDHSQDRLIVAGYWGDREPSLRAVPVEGGVPETMEHGGPPSPAGRIADFDLSPDGRLLAIWEIGLRGDIWMLETETGSF
jgi:Tol biopolymer transport system component/serine/threonine protein kinase